VSSFIEGWGRDQGVWQFMHRLDQSLNNGGGAVATIEIGPLSRELLYKTFGVFWIIILQRVSG